MKYAKQPKRHIVPDDYEWRALANGINEYRKQVINEDGRVEVVNELLIKIIDAELSVIIRIDFIELLYYYHIFPLDTYQTLFRLKHLYRLYSLMRSQSRQNL